MLTPTQTNKKMMTEKRKKPDNGMIGKISMKKALEIETKG